MRKGREEATVATELVIWEVTVRELLMTAMKSSY